MRLIRLFTVAATVATLAIGCCRTSEMDRFIDDLMSKMTLEEKLEWIRKFFNEYIPELEKRLMTKEELEDWVFLPDELRIWFYHYFPEHGLNMAKYTEQLMYDLQCQKKFQTVDRRFFSHYD